MGEALFVLCLTTFVFVIGNAFCGREDLPPPNFALVALGLLNKTINATLVAFFENQLCSVFYWIGAALLEEGFGRLPDSRRRRRAGRMNRLTVGPAFE